MHLVPARQAEFRSAAPHRIDAPSVVNHFDAVPSRVAEVSVFADGALQMMIWFSFSGPI